ncbi:MAG: hypothetical protein H0T88_06560 [Lysobacter sp.]|nr:hypothetical protein [Lysobacter sp.]
MTLPWSPEQREWLRALGHPVMVLAVDGSIASNVDQEPIMPPQTTVAVTGSHGRTPVPVPGQADDSALHRALLKATGLPTDQAEQVLGSMGVHAAALRADPAAKRALWPSLRRLRKGHSR